MSFFSGALNPLSQYLSYIKLALLAAAALIVLGAAGYTYYVFQDRAALQLEAAQLKVKIEAEQARAEAAINQANQILAMSQKITEAIKHVKVQSSVYIDKVEAASLALPVAGGVVLVPAGVPVPGADLPGEPAATAAGAGAATAGD